MLITKVTLRRIMWPNLTTMTHKQMFPLVGSCCLFTKHLILDKKSKEKEVVIVVIKKQTKGGKNDGSIVPLNGMCLNLSS